nr:PREDICTED: microspherule protein 1-like [Bemisia tabaci]XP_018902335.1 PREDICTED: microspherule protein 1-like [Bemisia tabaci]
MEPSSTIQTLSENSHIESMPSTPISFTDSTHSPSLSELNMKRRSSSRSIKRKKFDDELVESSLNTSMAPIASGKVQRIRTSSLNVPSPSAGGPIQHPSLTPSESNSPMMDTVIKPPRRASNKSLPNSGSGIAGGNSGGGSNSRSGGSRYRKATKHANTGSSTKDLGRWKPMDDLALIINVQQTNCLRTVQRGVKFSCRFTLQEIQQRWYALLYDQVISRLAILAMRNLHPEVIAGIEAKALFSVAEEQLLASMKVSSNPTLETFQELLTNNALVFYPKRTAKALYTHWQLMKQYQLISDQTDPTVVRSEHFLTFSDCEETLNDTELSEPREAVLDQELALADRRAKKEINVLKNEVNRWQVLVDAVTGITSQDFDNQTLAVLKGCVVRYLMRSKEITIGRKTRDHNVDVDLSLEGPAWKVSRRQATIRLNNNGDFYISSEGKRALYVDAKPILNGHKYKLTNNSVLEVLASTGFDPPLSLIILCNAGLVHNQVHIKIPEKYTTPLD